MIHFVGAGPGAPDLITVRGMKLLRAADVIIYAGSLVNPELLQYASAHAAVYDSAFMTLEEIMALMLEADRESREIVRLHSGDPSVYGAIREQMDLLDEHHVDYDTCPGVSACFGAAASLKLEYTLPGKTQTLILTRMKGKTAVPEKESIRSFAEHDCTMVIFLSTGLLEEVSRELIEGGFAPDAPAAIVYKATWPEEKVVRCTVGTLAQAAKDNGITKTALITVGGFLGDRYERSKLYDPTFTTEFRQASHSK